MMVYKYIIKYFYHLYHIYDIIYNIYMMIYIYEP